MKYVIKCNDCHRDIKQTDNLIQSFQGGFCPECMSHNLETVERVQQQTWRGVPYEQPDLFSEEEES